MKRIVLVILSLVVLMTFSNLQVVAAGEVYEEGMYKVGKDIPAGEYLVTTDPEATYTGYYCVSKDSTGSYSSILASDNFYNRAYITVSKGNYIQVKRGSLTLAKDVPAFKPEGKTYPDGMYKVGRDIKAGEYKLKATGTTMGYFQVVSDSSGGYKKIVSSGNFNGTRYVTVKKGQYLKLMRASLSYK